MRGGAPRRKFWAILHVFNTKKAKSWESSKTRTDDGTAPLRLVPLSRTPHCRSASPRLCYCCCCPSCCRGCSSSLAGMLSARATRMQQRCRAFMMRSACARRTLVSLCRMPCVTVQPFAAQRLLFDELCQSLGLKKLSRMQCFDRTLRFCYWCRSCQCRLTTCAAQALHASVFVR